MNTMSDEEQEYFDEAFSQFGLNESYRPYLESVISGLCDWYGDKAYRKVSDWFWIVAQTIGKLPVKIEAVQWTGDNSTEMMRFAPTGGFKKDNYILYNIPHDPSSYQYILSPGDYAVRINDEYFGLDKEAFEKTFKEMS